MSRRFNKLCLFVVILVVFSYFLSVSFKYWTSPARVARHTACTTNRFVDPATTEFSINPPNICPNTPFLLVIVVITKGSEFAVRSAIRETWGSRAYLHQWDVSIAFLVGKSNNALVESDILAESRLHRDIVQYDSLDLYEELTLKTVVMLKWVRDHCPTAKFVARADTDLYINIKKTHDLLMHYKNSSSTCLGYIFKGGRPVRDKMSKYYISHAEYNHTNYPTYASGALYFLTSDLMARLYQLALHTPMFKFEDIYITGTLFYRIPHRRHVHIVNIRHQKREVNGCSFMDNLSGHRVSIDDMFAIHRQLYVQTPALCGRAIPSLSKKDYNIPFNITG